MPKPEVHQAPVTVRHRLRKFSSGHRCALPRNATRPWITLVPEGLPGNVAIAIPRKPGRLQIVHNQDGNTAAISAGIESPSMGDFNCSGNSFTLCSRGRVGMAATQLDRLGAEQNEFRQLLWRGALRRTAFYGDGATINQYWQLPHVLEHYGGRNRQTGLEKIKATAISMILQVSIAKIKPVESAVT